MGATHLGKAISVDAHQVEDLARRSFLESILNSGSFGLLVLVRLARY